MEWGTTFFPQPCDGSQRAVDQRSLREPREREGQTQQEKADAQQEVAKHEAQADQARTEAAAEEQRQREEQTS